MRQKMESYLTSDKIRRAVIVVFLIMCFAVISVGNSLADRMMPQSEGGLDSVGRTAFSYLSGIRIFIAQTLWNRLDTQMHDYYEVNGKVNLTQIKFMLPNFAIINWLDPQFVDSYYVAPAILLKNGYPDKAITAAREGVKNNPRSGILLTGLANILFSVDKTRAEATKYCDIALQSDTVWRYDEEKFNGYAIMLDIYRKTNQPAKAAVCQKVLNEIKSNPNATTAPADTGD